MINTQNIVNKILKEKKLQVDNFTKSNTTDGKCQRCSKRPYTKMVLIEGVIPKFVCDECDKELLRE